MVAGAENIFIKINSALLDLSIRKLTVEDFLILANQKPTHAGLETRNSNSSD